MSEVLRTARLSIRPWEEADAPRLFAMLREPEVTKWTSTPEPMVAIAEALERIERWSQPIEGHPRLGIWAIVPHASGEASGTVLLRPLADSPAIEIGWSLHPDSWGSGYASEAAGAALEHAWRLGHGEVIAIMWPDNHRSAAVCDRIGMVDLGIVDDPWYGTDEEPTSRMFRATRPG